MKTLDPGTLSFGMELRDGGLNNLQVAGANAIRSSKTVQNN